MKTTTVKRNSILVHTEEENAAYNIKVAESLGLNAAILLQAVYAYGHYGDRSGGSAWAIHNLDGWARILPYLSRSAIKNALDLLVEKKILNSQPTKIFNGERVATVRAYQINHDVLGALFGSRK